MAQRVTMRPTGPLTEEMVSLIENQAEGTETFQLPGIVVVALAQLARRGLEVGERVVEDRPVGPLFGSARQMVEFFTPAQRFALRSALLEK